MIEYCRTMTDIRRWLFTHRQQSNGYVIDRINSDGDDDDDVFKPHSPSPDGYFVNHLYPNISIITSTPITDDEGYRTRLPTTASADSSFIHYVGSPILSHHADLDWTSEIGDDECF